MVREQSILLISVAKSCGHLRAEARASMWHFRLRSGSCGEWLSGRFGQFSMDSNRCDKIHPKIRRRRLIHENKMKKMLVLILTEFSHRVAPAWPPRTPWCTRETGNEIEYISLSACLFIYHFSILFRRGKKISSKHDKLSRSQWSVIGRSYLSALLHI